MHHPTNKHLPRRFWRAVVWTLAVSFPIVDGGWTSAGQSVSQSPGNAGAAGGWTTSLETPLRLIGEARNSYSRITDYQCLFIKRERLRGQLQAENVTVMKVRTEPFSVYLRWLRPQASVGQEACFVNGKNNGMMRVHSTGILGAVGFVSLAPDDPRALENSRHTIKEAGIGHLIEKFGGRWDFESRLRKTQVRVGEYEYNKRRCTRVETLHPDNSGKEFTFYRSVLYFDQSTHLPIRVENYDWPHRGSDPNGDLVESYSFADLRLNVGVPAATFDH